ncbi:MAG: AAA family ATPase, partial [Lactiplantibacillus plantarum]|nr:AAA family ATPase [Lactiplantibacillus plantarum]
MNGVKKAIRQINLSLGNKQNKILAFTTSESIIAQRTIVANLGMMYARANKRTIILDTDFTTEIFLKTFNLSKGQGLSNYIDDNSVDLKEIIRKVSVPNLSVISSGTLSLDDTQYLIGDSRFCTLLERVSQDYDRVLINIMMSPDSVTLSRITESADGTIMIVNPKQTRKKKIYQMMRELCAAKVNI